MPNAFFLEIERSAPGVLCPVSQENWFGGANVSGLIVTDARYNTGLRDRNDVCDVQGLGDNGFEYGEKIRR